MGAGPVFANSLDPKSIGETAPSSLVLQKEDFQRESLLTPYRQNTGSSFQLLNPNRFSMNQSVSMSFGSGGDGSYSSGLYLNTISYRLADPLTLSMDIGFHAPFYSSMQGLPSGNLWDGTTSSSLVLPRIGLNYQPTDNTLISLQLVNGADAVKAYGYPTGNPFWRPW